MGRQICLFGRWRVERRAPKCGPPWRDLLCYVMLCFDLFWGCAMSCWTLEHSSFYFWPYHVGHLNIVPFIFGHITLATWTWFLLFLAICIHHNNNIKHISKLSKVWDPWFKGLKVVIILYYFISVKFLTIKN